VEQWNIAQLISLRTITVFQYERTEKHETVKAVGAGMNFIQVTCRVQEIFSSI
jgi:hypothetical protein